MKITKLVARWLFSLTIPVLLFTISVSFAANSAWLYEWGFSRYDVGSVTGLAPEELDKIAHGLIDYWNSGDETINITAIKDGQSFTVFTEREVSHLVDVKAMFRLVYKCLMGSFIFALIFLVLNLFLWRDRRQLAWGLIWGGIFSIAIMVALGLAAIIDFHWLFWQFHLVSFANDLWLLPFNDYLIMLFPEGFWFDAAIFCTVLKIVMALILGGVGIWILRKYRNTDAVKRDSLKL
jgi:integral membrane protein (TIGR01906 family)